MADVARDAGVHVTTVSLALRNHPKIPIEKRTQIRKLATDMGYRPDPLLQALIAYRSRTFLRRNPPTLAYVTNWNSRFGWKNVTAHPQFFLGAKARASQLGYNLEHFWLGEQSLHPKRLSQILRARSINGLIVASQLPVLNPTSGFEWEFFSGVKIDHVPRQLALHNVTNDQLGIIRLAVPCLGTRPRLQRGTTFTMGNVGLGDRTYRFTATAIPEPAEVAAGLALFALGAAGVRQYRRRRRVTA